MTKCEEIETAIEGSVLEIVMARPKTKNALTVAMYAAMTEALNEAAANDAVLAVLFRGEGGNFSSGNDLRDFMENPPTGPDSTVFRFMHAIAEFPKPVIAVVDGFAVGIGTTMLFHCDLVYVAEDAKFSMPFVALGLVPEAASSYFLTRQVGQRRAAELLYFAEPFGAAVAREIGLVSAIVPAADVLTHARARAAKLVQQAPGAIRKTKQLLNEHQSKEMLAHLDHEADVFAAMLQEPECREAFAAFFEKRKPDFAKLRGG